MVTITFNGAASGNEQAPVAISEPSWVTLLRGGGIKQWWSVTGMVEGVAAGSALPVKLKSLLDTDKFANSLKLSATKKPILAYDDTVKRYFLKLGYGGDLARRTLNLAHLSAATPGSGYVKNDTVTLSNGVVLTYTGTNGTFSTDGSHTITNFGTFTTRPTTPLTQVSTSGAGTGATFITSFKTDCGALELVPSPDIIPDTNFMIFAVVRFPTPEEQPDSGGFIFGSQLNEGETHNTVANSRYWGLRCGNDAVSAGAPLLIWKGDGNYIHASPALGDMRDGRIHVLCGTLPATGEAPRLWVDGVLNDVRVGGTFSGLNTTVGTDYLRAGASGRPAVGPTGGMLGDIFELIVAPLNETVRKNLMQALLDTYRPGLISASA